MIGSSGDNANGFNNIAELVFMFDPIKKVKDYVRVSLSSVCTNNQLGFH